MLCYACAAKLVTFDGHEIRVDPEIEGILAEYIAQMRRDQEDSVELPG